MSATALPTRPTIGLRRRWLLAAVALALLATFALAAWSFAWPSAAVPREVALGQLDDFEPGTVTSYVVTRAGVRELSLAGDYGRRPQDYPLEGRNIVHLARLADGELRAFVGEDRNFGWTVVWYPLAGDYWRRDDTSPPGRFAEPRRGPFWDIEGHRIFGPAPGDLQPLDPRVLADGTVVVDVGPILEASYQTQSPIRY